MLDQQCWYHYVVLKCCDRLARPEVLVLNRECVTIQMKVLHGLSGPV